GNGRHGEIPHDADDHKNEVRNILLAKESVALLGNLPEVVNDHLFLYLADDGAKDIGYREPQKNVDVAGEPCRKGMLQAIEYGQAKDKRSKYGQYHKLKCPQRVNTKGSGLEQNFQYLAHPFLHRIPEIVIGL